MIQSPKARKNLTTTYTFLLGGTLILWLMAKSDLSLITRFPVSSLTQLAGLFAAVLVGLNLLLAARLKYFENLFGGLDKVYKQHKLTGKVAFYLMLVHPTLLLFGSAGLWQNIKIYFLNISYMPYNYGKLALFGFTLLIVLTLYSKLSYHIWLFTHRFMVVPLVFLALHVATIPSDVSVFLPLRIWILGVLSIGLIMYIYKVLLYKQFGPRFKYEINKVTLRGAIAELELSPVGKTLNFEPGQFAFAVFSSKAVTTEEHPFSISSSPESPNIRLSIKRSGDFTSTLTGLTKGEFVFLYGPYGQFGKRALSSSKEVVMIAGGIGVTPFLSIANYANTKKITSKFRLFYSYKNDSESQYKEELAKLLGGSLFAHNSDRNGHLTAEIIKQKIGDLSNKLILLCGPRTMMKSLTAQLLAAGVTRQNIIFEDFDLK